MPSPNSAKLRAYSHRAPLPTMERHVAPPERRRLIPHDCLKTDRAGPDAPLPSGNSRNSRSERRARFHAAVCPIISLTSKPRAWPPARSPRTHKPRNVVLLRGPIRALRQVNLQGGHVKTRIFTYVECPCGHRGALIETSAFRVRSDEISPETGRRRASCTSYARLNGLSGWAQVLRSVWHSTTLPSPRFAQKRGSRLSRRRIFPVRLIAPN
jgi:hypothetical protein